MSDTTYDVYQHYGTAAARALFTPAPAGGITPIYIWYESDTDDAYIYTTAWKGPFRLGGGKLLTADPAAPGNDTWWVRRTGASPTMDVELRVRIAGVTTTIAGVTI